jgi:hypothetical protein
VVVIFIWLFIAMLWITLYPIWESRASFVFFYRKVTGRVLDTSGTKIERTEKAPSEPDDEYKTDQQGIVEVKV